MKNTKKIIDILNKLRNISKLIQNPYKFIAYENAIEAVSTYSNNTSHDISLVDVDKIPIIGKKIKDKLKEIIKTGKLKELIVIDKMFDKLIKIPGFGSKFIGKILDEHKIKRIEDIPNIYPLNDMQKIGFKYRKNLDTKLTKKQVENIVSRIPGNDMVIAGSYRRKKKFMGDVDILVFGNYTIPNDAVVLTHGNKRSSFLIPVSSKSKKMAAVDIRKISFDSYIPALIYFTGSKNFNIQLRSHAKTLGYKLNEYSLSLGNKKIKIKLKSEEDLFNKLGLKYVKPENR